MAELREFSPAQIIEAEKWYLANSRPLWLYGDRQALADVYFKLKRLPINLKTTEFVVGVDYKNKEDILSGKEQANLSFLNPHMNNKADQFAKDFLIAQLSKL